MNVPPNKANILGADTTLPGRYEASLPSSCHAVPVATVCSVYVKPASSVVHKISRLEDSVKTCYNGIKNGKYVIGSYGRGQMEGHELLEVRRSRNVIHN